MFIGLVVYWINKRKLVLWLSDRDILKTDSQTKKWFIYRYHWFSFLHCSYYGVIYTYWIIEKMNNNYAIMN